MACWEICIIIVVAGLVGLIFVSSIMQRFFDERRKLNAEGTKILKETSDQIVNGLQNVVNSIIANEQRKEEQRAAERKAEMEERAKRWE